MSTPVKAVLPGRDQGLARANPSSPPSGGAIAETRSLEHVDAKSLELYEHDNGWTIINNKVKPVISTSALLAKQLQRNESKDKARHFSRGLRARLPAGTSAVDEITQTALQFFEKTQSEALQKNAEFFAQTATALRSHQEQVSACVSTVVQTSVANRRATKSNALPYSGWLLGSTSSTYLD